MLDRKVLLALIEAEEILSLAATPSFPDPLYADEIRALGDRIGYGALMATASAIWCEKARADGLGGSEFVAGPCRATVERTLSMVRDAMSDNA